MKRHLDEEHPVKGVVMAFGLVFGDIGTSPIYTLTVVFLLTKPTADHVLGVLSLIVWTLVTLVSVQYAWLAMSLSNKGEGGTIVLKEILIPLLKKGKSVAFVTLLSYVGISLLIGDGIITPAISILSAVEGLRLVPAFGNIGQNEILTLAGLVAVVLFAFQRRGTDRLAGMFGPCMAAWFAALAISGLAAIFTAPSVVQAINPYYAGKFMLENGIAGFFVLSEVILCATGGEALYADMGQLGRKPITRAWYFVFAALLLNYLGQGAYSMNHPGVDNVLFEMIRHQAEFLYVPFLLLSIAATVIASQAMISGMFSIVYQGINTHVFPLFKVDYTSRLRSSQIYIGSVNWFLLISVLAIMILFQGSHRLAAAYGLAVTGTMTLTGIMMTWIFFLQGRSWKAFLSLVVTLTAGLFLLSNTYKIPHGGYWSLILAAIPFGVMMIYTSGQERLLRSMRPLTLEKFLKRYGEAYSSQSKISGTALYFVRGRDRIPPYVLQIMFNNDILYQDNVFVTVTRSDKPFGVSTSLSDRAPGLRWLRIQMGYMEIVAVENLLRKFNIDEKSIFYGLEEIVTRNPVWRIYSLIKRLTPSIIQFHKLPPHKLHGVVMRVEI